MEEAVKEGQTTQREENEANWEGETNGLNHNAEEAKE